MSDYDDLVSQRNNTQAKYNACQRRINSIDAKLRRLRPVKQTLTEKKASFRTLKKEDEQTVNGKYSWKGNTYEKTFKTKGEEMVREDQSFIDGPLDLMLDSINNEITRLENERMNEFGLLGRLGSALNSLKNKIENFFN